MTKRGFSLEDFGKRHPGGKIGLQLQTVAEWLGTHPENTPILSKNTTMDEVISVISKGGRGCAAVVDGNGKMLGIITDGDLRRAIDAKFFKKTAAEIMTPSPLSLSLSMRISEVIDLFTEKRIGNAFVLDGGKPVGVIDMKGLLEEGYL